jgi:hypothetical protein
MVFDILCTYVHTWIVSTCQKLGRDQVLDPTGTVPGLHEPEIQAPSSIELPAE